MAHKEKWKDLASQLISSLAGFEPKSENHRLSLQYILSNFNYHRFLDTDSLKVGRSINGLRDKFAVHAQDDKAAALTSYTERFLNCQLGAFYPKSDVHYSVLSLLLCLADSPTNATYHPVDLDGSKVDDLPDNFDWVSYLMEGITLASYNESDDELSEWSDDDGDDRIDGNISVRKRHKVTTTFKADASQSSNDSTVIDEDGKVAMMESMKWLHSNLVPPYWSSSFAGQLDVAEPLNRYCTLANDWTAYARSVGHPGVHDMVTMTELQIVRETIWLLLGVTSGFVYSQSSDGSVSPNPAVQVTHLTPGSLQQLLLRFCEAATILCCLREFDEAALSCETGNDDNKNFFVNCQTYQAYTACLHGYLKEFHSTLLSIEKNLINQSDFVSLSQLEARLHCKFAEQRSLHHVHAHGLLRDCDDTAQCVCHLLDTIWKELLYFDCAGHETSVHKVLLYLWTSTVHPYLNILDDWITSGFLHDCYAEMCIKIVDVVPHSQRLWSDKVEIRTSKTDTSKLVPAFLAPVIDQILLAGKSMEIAKDLIKPDSAVHSESTMDLYSELMQAFRDVSLSFQGDEVDEGFRPSFEKLKLVSQHLTTVAQTLSPLDSSPVGEIPHLVEVWGIDPLMKQYFESIYPSSQIRCATQHTDQCSSDTLLEGVVAINPVLLVSLTINNSLFPIIHRKCTHACSLLVELIKSSYQLETHFKHIQLIFLMEAGDVMHQFSEEIFHRVSSGEVWQETFVLDAILHEAIQPRYPELEKYICTSLKEVPGTANRSLSIHAITALKLCYKVPWPVDSIIDSESLEIYNNVFQFLLQVKWAKWNLEECKCRAVALVGLPADQIANVHLMHLLRARMLHFVINLNNYLMTRILYSIGIEFEKSISRVKDFSEIIQLHKEYVTKIHDRCLLNEKASFVKEAIFRILSLALDFGRKWQLALTTTSVREIDAIDSEFTKCTHFLVTLLNKIIKRGSFPHLETLAFSIASLEDGVK